MNVLIEALRRWERTLLLVSTHRVVVDDAGESASGEAYCEAHHVTGSNDLVMPVRYDDRYEKADGRWRFARRHVTVLWVSEGPVNARP